MNTSVMKSLNRGVMESSQYSNMVIIYKTEGKNLIFIWMEKEKGLYKKLGSRS